MQILHMQTPFSYPMCKKQKACKIQSWSSFFPLLKEVKTLKWKIIIIFQSMTKFKIESGIQTCMAIL